MLQLYVWPSEQASPRAELARRISKGDLSELKPSRAVLAFREAVLARMPELVDTIDPVPITNIPGVPLDLYVCFEVGVEEAERYRVILEPLAREFSVELHALDDDEGDDDDPDHCRQRDEQSVFRPSGATRVRRGKADNGPICRSEVSLVPDTVLVFWLAHEPKLGKNATFRKLLTGSLEGFLPSSALLELRDQISTDFPEFRLHPDENDPAMHRFLVAGIPAVMDHDNVHKRIVTNARRRGLSVYELWEQVEEVLQDEHTDLCVRVIVEWGDLQRWKGRSMSYWDVRGEVDPRSNHPVEIESIFRGR